jgi:hypothetical protein
MLNAQIVMLGLASVMGADLHFQRVVLDESYIAYERDVGDIDGDGRNDVAAVMEGDTTVQIFRAPTWSRSTLITFTGDLRYPRADDFKLADVDGDGDLDVVTRLGRGPSDDGAGIAVWCENLSRGSKFIQHLIGNSPEYVKDIVVADFDRDGRPDVAMRMDTRTQLWLQEPDGPTRSGASSRWTEVLLTHPAHEGMETGDLDMDGDPDLILNGYWFETPDTPAAARGAANYVYHVIDSAWFNQTGEWTKNSCKVAVGDFDGDGKNDVVFSHSERPGHAVAWYGSVSPREDSAWSKHAVKVVDYCHTLQAADFDLDGDVDLLIGGMIQSRHRGLRLMRNDGKGAGWTESIIQTDGSYSAEIGDIDNDGDPDIVGIRNWNSAPTWIYRNDVRSPGLDRWTYHQVSAAHVRTFGLCFPDADGDGDLDIASGPFVYLNPGPPLTDAWTQVPLPGGVHAFATFDVDGDKFADLIAQKDNSSAGRIDLFWIEAANAAGTSWAAPILIGHVPRSDHPQGFQGYRIAQLVAGGRPEIAVSTMQGIYYFAVPRANPGADDWPRTFVAPNDSDEGIGIADIDGDGRLDIGFTSGASEQVKWARNPGDGTGNWSVFAIGSFPEADWPDRCEAADLNGDGRVDIVVTEENPGTASDALACWWEQPAGGAAEANWPRHTITRQYTMNSLDVADMDQDGDLDLILAEHRGTKRIAVWENDGRGAFSERRVDEGHESHLGACTADLDGDGDLDLVSIAYDDFTKVHLWRNDNMQPETTGPRVVTSRVDPWGVVKATLGDGPEGDGTILLENRALRVRYAAKRFHDGNKDHVITEFLVKKTGGQLAVGDQLDGIWMNADEGRGRMTSARVTFDGPDRKTLRVEWDGGKVVQEFTIWPNQPIVGINYIKYGVNIVDMVNSVDALEVYGAKAWQEARAKVTDETLLNIPNPHHRLTRDLYPRYPFPLLAGKDWEKLEPRELTYHGHLILGAYKQETGLGFGRVFPVQDADYVKLLNMGFEVFANWQQPHREFTGYLYAVTGGPNELMAVGKTIAAGATAGANPGTVDFFVSRQGKDTWSGKRADPNEKDGPFATVARAREAVRALLKTQKEPRPVRVILRGGTYYLDAPLEFGPEDSGTERAPVIYRAAPGEKVVLSGGRRLDGGHWGEVHGRKAWMVDIPEVKEGRWRFRQLFVNGERRPRTRLPKQGEYRIASLPGYTGDFLRSPTRQFVYAPGDIVPTWRNLQDVEVVGITRWLDNRLPIESVNGETRTVTFDRPSLFALVSGDRPGVYWVENVFDALDTPGQWYLDRPGGVLYYLPRPGEEMPSAETVAPRLAQVVRVVGREGAPVHDLRFEGLIFAHTEWQPPADYASSLQAGIEVPGALLFDCAERCAVTDGRIEHIGNYGVEVGVGCADIEIARNRITDIGAGGIRIGHFFSWETDGSGQLTERGLQRKAAMPTGPHSRRITVADNEIAHGGRFTPEAVGVFVGDNADNQVIHNHIYDLFYSGISVGSVQDFGPSEARGNIVEYNHVHDIGQGVLSDMGGIYACSTPDSRIAYNVVHDVVRRDYGGWGIYPDEGCHDLLIEKNVVYRCQDGTLFAHHNRNITAQNNIFALTRGAQVERGGIGGFELTCRRNLIYYREGKAIGDYGSAHSGRDICAFDRNLYWNASGQPVLFANQSLSEWQATGQDKDSLIADPLFVDPAHGDFRLRPGSPAAQIGFEPWDMSAVGPRPLRATPPAAAPASGPLRGNRMNPRHFADASGNPEGE